MFFKTKIPVIRSQLTSKINMKKIKQGMYYHILPMTQSQLFYCSKII